MATTQNKDLSPLPYKTKTKSVSLHSLPHKKHLIPPTLFESASSLLHSVQSISFPKAGRNSPRAINFDQNIFDNIYPVSDKYKKPIDFKSKRSTSFGYGQKQFIPLNVLKNAKENPAANNYNLPSIFDKLDKGKTFGLSRQCFEKTYIPGVDHLPLGVAKELPGPGQYNILPTKQKNKGFSLVGKGKNFNQIEKDDGPFRIYEPNMQLVEPQRYKKIRFGTSQRGNFSERKKEDGPGPGTYEYMGGFQKYKRKY